VIGSSLPSGSKRHTRRGRPGAAAPTTIRIAGAPARPAELGEAEEGQLAGRPLGDGKDGQRPGLTPEEGQDAPAVVGEIERDALAEPVSGAAPRRPQVRAAGGVDVAELGEGDGLSVGGDVADQRDVGEAELELVAARRARHQARPAADVGHRHAAVARDGRAPAGARRRAPA
jgi:hypothetical protein